jgi:hypothetical protein
MKRIGKIGFVLMCVCSFVMMYALSPSLSMAAKPVKKATKLDPEYSWGGKIDDAFNVDKMSDMSDFDPATWVSPKGDTIKVAYINAFSGPAAINGHIHFVPIMFAAHDINKRGASGSTARRSSSN